MNIFVLKFFFQHFFSTTFFQIFAYRVCDEKLKGVLFQVFFSLRAYHFRSYVIVVAVHAPFIIFITTPLYLYILSKISLIHHFDKVFDFIFM